MLLRVAFGDDVEEATRVLMEEATLWRLVLGEVHRGHGVIAPGVMQVVTVRVPSLL